MGIGVQRGTAAIALPCLLLMVGTCQGFGRLGLAFILPGLEGDVAGSYAGVGLLLTISYAAYALGCLAMRWIVHWWGEVAILRAGIVGQAAAFALIGMAPGPGVAAAGMAVSGLTSAFVWISATALIGELASARWRNLTFGAAMSTTGLCVAASGWFLTRVSDLGLETAAWRVVVLAQGAVALALVVAAFLLRFRRVVPEASGPPGLAADAHGLMAADAVAAGTAAEPVVRGSRRRAVRQLTLVFFLFGGTQVLFLNFYVAAVAAETDYSLAEATGFYSLVGIASIIGGLAGGRAVDAIGPQASMIVCLGSLVACVLVMVAGVDPLVAPAAALFGGAITAVGATAIAYLADALPRRDVSAAFAEITLGLGVGQMVSPYVGGWLIDTSGSFVSSYVLCLVLSVAGAVAAIALPRLPRRRRAAGHV